MVPPDTTGFRDSVKTVGEATGQYHHAVASGSGFITRALGNRATHPLPRGGTDLLLFTFSHFELSF